MNRNRKIGVTVGKFMPLHKGHEAMIEFGAALMDEMIVIVSSCPYNTDLDERYEIIKQKYAGRNITVLKHHDLQGDPEKVDEHGTATDYKFWEYWINVFNILAPDATHFVSSDRYGKKAAGHLGIRWLAFDPDRELINISATKIRNDKFKYWKYIAKEFRPSMITSVVVVGPESCGKSTLVKDLGQAWNSPAVPEYGRIMTEIVGDDNWTRDHFLDIVRRQQAMNNLAAKNSETGLIFVDTEAYTTYLYCMEYLNTRSNTIKRMADREYFDMYVNVLPHLPWIDDGSRVMPDLKARVAFSNNMTQYLKQTKDFVSHVVTLNETDRKKRVDAISQEIMRIIKGDELDFSEQFAKINA